MITYEKEQKSFTATICRKGNDIRTSRMNKQRFINGCNQTDRSLWQLCIAIEHWLICLNDRRDGRLHPWSLVEGSVSSASAETNSPPGIYRTVQFSPDKEITQKIHRFLMHDESLIMNWTEYIRLPWLWLCKFHRLPKLNTVNLIVQYSTLIISSRGKRILVLTRNVGRFNGKVEALQ